MPKSFVGVSSAMPQLLAGRACLGRGRGPASPFPPPAGPLVPTPTQWAIVLLSAHPCACLPARQAKGSEGTGRPVTPGRARGESQWLCGSQSVLRGYLCWSFLSHGQRQHPRRNPLDTGVAGQLPGACLPLPCP